ncbi:hypothetical protein ACA910_016559 [Epithemia clementina (nom. ined.)]
MRLRRICKVVINGEEEFILEHLKKGETTWKKVVAAEDTFDVIHLAHQKAGHVLTPKTTHALVKEEYHNVSIDVVKIFIDGCPECATLKKKATRHVGAVKPIQSKAFHDCFQADLINMMEEDSKGAIDPQGAEMKYLLVLKDHFTMFTVLVPIPNKEPKTVAYHLQHIFGIIGFPAIYQSNNGCDVSGEEVLKMVKEFYTTIHTIQGRVCVPRDQGSVEQGNQEIKKVILCFQAEERKKNPNINWTMLTGRTMATLNGRSTAKKKTIPYYTLTGQHYWNLIPQEGLVNVNTKHHETTVIERILATGSTELCNYYAAIGELLPEDLPVLKEIVDERIFF